MHGYFWDRQRLKDKLSTFTGGQFLIETKGGLVLRGEVKDWSIPDMNKRRIFVEFVWSCEEHFGKWLPVKPHPLDVEFRFYYFQRKREDREERIKLWTPLGEICRFFQKGDPSNLIKQESGKFLPSYEPQPNSGPED